ncbi:site-specific integrase [Limibaculum sp. FT325]|uniref:tyrosine-type recombinase/integrase n=1 Tax=Thermohalobaculum sediminis TaxID=2939436 RepID=UPI0020C042CE|nr:tyrosine-type recombinase/integrase [Limibaculum sediminis]MCL5776851.1 site-specific integrase [Limibaculum sediminis]
MTSLFDILYINKGHFSDLRTGAPMRSRTPTVEEIFNLAEGAYAPRTLSAYRADLNNFMRWCEKLGERWLPVSAETLARFVDEHTADHRASTIRRRIAAVVFAHRVCDLADPTTNSLVRLAVRRAARLKGERPEQAQGLTHAILKQILDCLPKTLAGLRDAALLSVGYDTLCRSSEIARIEIRHVAWNADGTGRLLVPYSKSDGFGRGRIAHLSPASSDRVSRWLSAACIAEGPLFQGLHLGRPSGRQLETCSIRRLVKRAAQNADIPEPMADRLSGHSMRVGAAQDMMVSGFDTLAIMQAGGWKKPDVVLRYVENSETRMLHLRRWRILLKEASPSRSYTAFRAE